MTLKWNFKGIDFIKVYNYNEVMKEVILLYTNKNRDADFKWFLDNYDNFYQKYGKKIIVIKNQSILGVFDDKNTAIDKTAKNYQLGTFIVQECNGDESGYTNYITSWELV